MNGPIVCATDFSPDSRAALLWACRQAALTGAEVVLLHVVHDPSSSPGFYRRPEGDWLRPMKEVAAEMMDAHLAEMRGLHPELDAPRGLSPRLVSGLPPGRIVEVAVAAGAALVVLGSRGRTGLAHVLLGSVAERVVQTAPMPVTVVKAEGAAQ